MRRRAVREISERRRHDDSLRRPTSAVRRRRLVWVPEALWQLRLQRAKGRNQLLLSDLLIADPVRGNAHERFDFVPCFELQAHRVGVQPRHSAGQFSELGQGISDEVPGSSAGHVDVRFGSRPGVCIEQRSGDQHELHVDAFDGGSPAAPHTEGRSEALRVRRVIARQVLASGAPAEACQGIECVAAVGCASGAPTTRTMALHPALGIASYGEADVPAQARP